MEILREFTDVQQHQQEKNLEMQVKVADEADKLNERIESEANTAGM